MKYRFPTHWKYSKDLDSLLFVGQLINEMLFDYTIDTYKPNVLNGHTIQHEALVLINRVNDEVLNEGNLKHLRNEILKIFKSDLAVKKLLGNSYEIFISKLKENDKPNYQKDVISSMHTYFGEKKYFEALKELIIAKVIENKNKSDLFRLTRSLITELMFYGYHKSFIYSISNNFFFDNKNNKIDSPNAIIEFLNIFDFIEREFEVVFLCDNSFKEFEPVLRESDFEIKSTLANFPNINKVRGFKSKKDTTNLYIQNSKIKANDHAAAHFIAHQKLRHFSNLFSLYHHKSIPKISDTALVKRIDNSYILNLTRPNRSITKKSDLPPFEAAKRMAKLMSDFKVSNHSTAWRFQKTVELHRLTIESQEHENQLLTLWAALETIVPKKKNIGIDRISQISKAIIPFVAHNYYPRMIKELKNDLFNWNSSRMPYYLDKVDDITDSDDALIKILALVSLTKYNELREELLQELTKYPLIRNRIFNYNKWLSNTKEIRNHIESHCEKVSWHIKRIYRARNILIHTGRRPSRLGSLVENLHNYIDAIIHGIEHLVLEEKARTIEHAVVEFDIYLLKQMKFLKENTNKEVTADNLIDSVFTSTRYVT